MPRFVVLRHELPPGHERPTHWDLMLEHAGALKTWALERAPNAATLIAAQDLVDHRLAYLDYEGAVSGDRGTVIRWDAGSYVLLDDSYDRWIFELAGDKLRGMAALERIAGPSWRFSFAQRRG